MSTAPAFSAAADRRATACRASSRTGPEGARHERRSEWRARVADRGAPAALGVVIWAAVLAGCAGGAGSATAPAAMSVPGPGDMRAVVERSAPLALVYRGPAGCDGCSEAAAALVRRSDFHFTVRYIGPREHLHLNYDNLKRASLYVQPGGGQDIPSALRSLGPSGRAAIKAYVRGGGRYVGICMGAYLAGSDPGMGLLAPGDTGWYLRTRGADTRTTDDAVIPVKWGGRTRDMYFQDGPFILASRVPGERILARYSNGRAAALVRPSGAGRVAVVGPHPEAPARWYRWAKLTGEDGDGLDADLGLELIDAVMAPDPGRASAAPPAPTGG